MMISRAQVNAVLRAYLDRINSTERRPAPGADVRPSDRVRLSDDARRISHFVKLAKALPDGRAERVARLRDAVARGEYNPDPQEVAQKIIERLIADRAIEEQDS